MTMPVTAPQTARTNVDGSGTDAIDTDQYPNPCWRVSNSVLTDQFAPDCGTNEEMSKTTVRSAWASVLSIATNGEKPVAIGIPVVVLIWNGNPDRFGNSCVYWCTGTVK